MCTSSSTLVVVIYYLFTATGEGEDEGKGQEFAITSLKMLSLLQFAITIIFQHETGLACHHRRLLILT